MESGITGSTEELVEDEKSIMMENFLEQVGSMRLEIQRIRNRIQIVKKFHEQIQKTIKHEIRMELEERVQQESLSITKSASQIRTNLKTIENLFADCETISPAIQRMKDVQISTLVRMLEEVMQFYMECLVDHRNKSLAIMEQQTLIVTGDAKREDVENLLEEGKIALFNNNILMDTLEAKLKLQDVEKRHEEIQKIEKSIIELRNLFIQLSFAVKQQGEQINTIDRFVNKSDYEVLKANKKLTQAHTSRGRHRKMKCYMVAGCGSLVAVIALVLLLLP